MMETKQNTPHHMYSVGMHTIEALKNSVRFDDGLTENEIKILRLTMLLHDSGKPAARTTDEDGTDHFKGHSAFSEGVASVIMHRLKYDNDTLDKVKRLVRYHDHRKKLTEPLSRARNPARRRKREQPLRKRPKNSLMKQPDDGVTCY